MESVAEKSEQIVFKTPTDDVREQRSYLQTNELFMIVVFFRMTPTLVQEGDVVAPFKPRQSHFACKRNHLFGRMCVDATI